MSNLNRLNRVNAEQKINANLSQETKKGRRKSVDKRESDFNPVDPARAYGVTKKEFVILEWVKLSVYRIIGALFCLAMFSIVALGTIAFIVCGNIMISFLIVVGFAIVFFCTVSKPIRKRARFVAKMKRLCKKKNYKLKLEQGFFDALVWSPDRIDFSLNTGKYTYLVHYLTVRKYRSAVTFCDKHSFYRTKFPPPNVFTIIFGFKPKTKHFKVSFPESYTIGTHKNINAIIVNPVCRDLYMKNKEGVTEPTGSGASGFGYTVYTGSGFLEAIVRNEESASDTAINF